MTTPTVASIGLPRQVFFDASGRPAAGGNVTTYLAGTTTLAATYANSSGLVANPNPIRLDARGEAEIWYDVAFAYKLVPTTANGTALPVQDNVAPPHTDGTMAASLPLTGGTLLGALELAGDALSPLQPVTLEQFSASLGAKASESELANYAALASTPLFASAGSARVGANNTSAPADSKVWDFFVASDGALQIRAINDAGTAATPAITAARTGTTISSLSFSATNVSTYGATYVNGVLTVINNTGANYGGQVHFVNSFTSAGPSIRVNPTNDAEWINAALTTVNATLKDATGDLQTRGLLKGNLSGATPGVGLGRIFVQPVATGLPSDAIDGDIVLQY